jgi:asparagine synthase (glutamine-hydrolysing)
MHSACGRYVIVFNGEIYNFRDLQCELEARGVRFRTTSDTDVLLAMFSEFGEDMLPRLHGMFAFVIWDRLTRRAFAARDPYGIKPLYVAETATGMLMGSQVKALLATGLVSREPSPRGQLGFWMLGSVPEPDTWYKAISTLQAGHCCWIQHQRVTRQTCWCDIGAAWRGDKGDTRSVPVTQEVQEAVRASVRASVDRHLVADVPVGVLLSGGVDSGTLAGLMAEAGAKKLTGVTITFAEFEGTAQDEQPAAHAIAQHFGIRHHVRRVTQNEFLSDLPRILDDMDQPSIDGVNTWYASKAIREVGLKVVVSGLGGDELFFGYESFRTLPKLVDRYKASRRVPGVVAAARLAARLLAWRSGNARWRHVPDWLSSIRGAWWLRRTSLAPEDLPRCIKLIADDLLEGFNPETWLIRMVGTIPQSPVMALGQIESATYLRNQLLRDSDWASMAHSVELRTPLVDAKLLADLSGYLPLMQRYPNKALLANVPTRPMPRDNQLRRKTGFSIPVYTWMPKPKGFRAERPSLRWMHHVAGSLAGASPLEDLGK